MKQLFLTFIGVLLLTAAFGVPVELGRSTINYGPVPNPDGGSLPCTKSITFITYGDNYDQERGAYWTMYTDVITTITCTQPIIVEEVRVRFNFALDVNNNLVYESAILEECIDDPQDGIDRCFEIMQPGDVNTYGNFTNLFAITNNIAGQ